MSSEPIIESGMTFGLYPNGKFFYIENSSLYKKINSSVKIAEFLLLDPSNNSKVLIIEAKSSSPRRESSQEKFNEFIKDICDKLTNALTLYMAIYLKRHSDPAFNELPSEFQSLNLETTSFRLILIIKGHQDS
jgi:hypothetical protein